MKSERWKQIDGLLQSTLALPPEGRAAFLAQACADDEVLRLEVESLLTHYDQTGDFLEAPLPRWQQTYCGGIMRG